MVALIAAYKQLCAKPQPYTLILSLSAEEETSGRKGLEISLPEMEAACGPIAFGVFGEPTSLEMAVAEKGLMVLDCTVEGVAGHAARNNGVNAIYKALDAIEWFRSKQKSLLALRSAATERHSRSPRESLRRHKNA